MPVDLEALTSNLFSTCDAMLGDTITITPPSASPVTLKVHASHRDRRADFGMSAATVQDAMLDIDMAQVPGKPGSGWTVTLPLVPGKTFEPRDVQRDESGRRWEFGLKELKGG
ncbi:hypothetical protein OOT33_13650 [Sphingobium sp. DEHP117]|uniref:head-tail joining protein n=1 Tax=Sphingobium sp. DEHP117 TaxID=2993436 RepID=UPI0027D758FE|nr:hypothetical protein [Sphingobium sp. DEHP117]MDQ4421467.1 hypothetical protein [Sphingobium sp. DEHP117]